MNTLAVDPRDCQRYLCEGGFSCRWREIEWWIVSGPLDRPEQRGLCTRCRRPHKQFTALIAERPYSQGPYTDAEIERICAELAQAPLW